MSRYRAAVGHPEVFFHRPSTRPTTANSTRRTPRADFFRDGEYGEYLEEFVRHFRLAPHIRLSCPVRSLEKTRDGWQLTFDDSTETFDRVILCLHGSPEQVEGKTVIVLGGGSPRSTSPTASPALRRATTRIGAFLPGEAIDNSRPGAGSG